MKLFFQNKSDGRQESGPGIPLSMELPCGAPGGAEHRAKLLGEAGTSVTVTVRHADGTQADYTVTRALVTQTNTTVSVTDGVGYIDCDSFGTQTGTYFQEGVRGNDSAVHAWIVDLRGNGGGLTSAAVSALGAFSGEGDLIYFVDQDGESTAQSYSGKDLTDKPAIVLMDSGSASASEIFAGGVLGTGSGIVIGGNMVYGHDGFAGELGHVVIKEGGRECGCGRHGCLETYCSANGIRRTVFEMLANRTNPSVLRGISYDDLTSARIYEAAMEGDHIAREAFRYTGRILGRALADFVTFSSPEAIILFGGLAKAGELIRQPTEEAMEESMLHCFKNKVKVLLSDLSEGNVAILGAAALAWDAYRKQNEKKA